MRKREVDIVVISDVHLGNKMCAVPALLNYLESIHMHTLILNGHFIDPYLNSTTTLLDDNAKKLLAYLKNLENTDTKIYYLADTQLERSFFKSYLSESHIQLREELILQLKGKSIWILHGQLFGQSMKLTHLFSKMGQVGKQSLRLIHRLMAKIPKYTQINRDIKIKPQQQEERLKQIGTFENFMIQTAHQRNLDYVITGYTHLPQMRSSTINNQKVTLLNAGNWMTHQTALEYKWGRWSIFETDPIEEVNPQFDQPTSYSFAWTTGYQIAKPLPNTQF